MAKRRPTSAITAAADRPVNTDESPPSTVDRTPSTVDRKPTWEDRTKRHTFHADRDTLARFKALSESTGESLARLHNRAMRELLDRET